jgi:hypothetical protein
MEKRRFSGEFGGFYDQCLAELRGRENFTEAWIPQLERFVTITAKLAELNGEIVDTEVEVEHTNKAGKTNKATSPAWRMFLALNHEANTLADKLKLSPASAPATSSKPKQKKSFDLKVA